MKQRLIDLLRQWPGLFKIMLFLHSTFKTLTSRYIWKYVFDPKGRSVIPAAAWIDLTYKCNLRCEQCSQANDLMRDDSRLRQKAQQFEELSLEQWKSLIDRLKDAGVSGVALSGGEIFLLGYTRDLVRHIRSRDLGLAIATNGTLLTREIAEEMVDLKVSTVSISLEGPEEIHNEICRSPQAFEQAVRGLRHLSEAKEAKRSTRPNLALGITLSSSNYLHLDYLPDVGRQFGAEIRVGMLNFYLGGSDPMPPESDKGDDTNLPERLRDMDFDQLRKGWNRFLSRAKELNVLIYTVPLHMGVDEIIRWYSDPGYSYARKCLAPWNSVYIDPYGRLLNCMLGNSVGDLRISTLDEAYNSEAYCEFRRKLRAQGLYRSCSRCCLLSNRLWGLIPHLSRRFPAAGEIDRVKTGGGAGS